MGKRGVFRNPKRRRAVVEMLGARDGPNCFYCGVVFDDSIAKRVRTLDHFVPRSHGGATTAENLRLACQRCNAWKQSRAAEAFVRSKRVRQRRAMIASEMPEHRATLERRAPLVTAADHP